MHSQEKSKILFVVNPISGGKEKHDWETSIKEYFKDKPHAVEFYLLTGKNDRVSIQHHIERIRPDKVVAVGGDGTVRMVADMLKETPMSLGIIPAGSANGMAKELKIPLDPIEALNVIAYGEHRKIDIVKINEEEICIHLSDVGLNAMLVKYFESANKRGMWGYARAVLRVLWQKKSIYTSLKMDDREIKRKAYMIVIANARTYGTGAVINPVGKLDDGLFEVIVIRKLNLLELLKMLITHKPFHPNRIEVFQTSSLEISIKRKTYFQIDGEYLGKVTSVKARILRQIINVMLPAVKDKELA